MKDLFFEKAGPKPAYADFRFSHVLDGFVLRIGDTKPETVHYTFPEADWEIGQRVEKLTKQGYKPAKKPTLPGIQTPAVIEVITGFAVPARYAKFLAEGPHPSGTVTDIPNFADGSRIVFDDPFIPGWLKMYGWDTSAPNAIPIALVEDGRPLSIDAKTGAIFIFDNSATKPHLKAAKNLDELLERVTVPKSPKAKQRR